MSTLVLDTHAWLWWEASPERLSASAAASIEQADRIAVCAVSCWELAMLVVRGRIELDRPVARWVQQALARGRVEPFGVTAQVALEAASLPQDEFPADPADRFIYASARLSSARLVTRDEHIRRYDPALTIW